MATRSFGGEAKSSNRQDPLGDFSLITPPRPDGHAPALGQCRGKDEENRRSGLDSHRRSSAVQLRLYTCIVE
jgi:hypothetical protein